MKALSRIYTALILLFLYAPIAVMVIFSFNSSGSVWVFEGFSLDWYKELTSNGTMLTALEHTIIIAILSAIISTIIGTSASVGILSLRKKFSQTAVMSITNIPMMNADIVTGISLMLLFVFFGKIIGISESLGFFTVLIAHITFNLPYVILSVMPKLKQTDSNLSEAALDLGCTPLQAFFKVVIPSISSGIFSGFIMAFTLSLDDFVISYFTCGHYQTLPIVIYNMTKKTVTPDTYALSTIMFGVIFILLMLYNIVSNKNLDKGVQKR